MDLAVVPSPRGAPVAPAGLVTTLQGLAMGTTWTVKLAGLCPQPAAVQAAVDERLNSLVAQMSHWEPESQITRFNRAAAGERMAIGEDFRVVMASALDIARRTDGAFDPALGHAADQWGFGPRLGGAEAASPFGWRDLAFDGDSLVQPGGVALDLSGIAKGYAVDAVAALLAQRGFASFLVEIGGEMFGCGLKPDGQPWWAQVEPPGQPMTARIFVALPGWGLATSGDYRRFHTVGERRLSHTLDPATLAPVESRIASVSVLAADAMIADAWATALTVLGEERGLAAAEQEDLAALFLLRDADGAVTPAASAAWQALWA